MQIILFVLACGLTFCSSLWVVHRLGYRIHLCIMFPLFDDDGPDDPDDWWKQPESPDPYEHLRN